MNRTLILALGCSALLLAGCAKDDDRPEPNTSFSSAGDAAAVAAVTGTYEAMTAQGVVTFTLCEDIDDEAPNNVFTDYGILDGDTCVVHNVLGEGRGKTEDVALGPITEHHENWLNPNEPADVSCTATAATPVRATLKIGGCMPYELHGALVLATAAKSDPYAAPYTLSLQLDALHIMRLDGQIPAQGRIEATYGDDLSCLGDGQGQKVTASFHRKGPEGCAAK